MTDLQQTLLITNFHNIIQELEGYSSHTFTTFSQHTSSTTNINIVLCDRLFITYFHNIITNSSSNISTSFNTSSTHLHHASTNSSTSFNKMNEYRFSFTAYSTNYGTVLHRHSFQQTMIQFFINTSTTYFNNILHRQSIFHFFITNISTNIQHILRNIPRNIPRNILHNKLSDVLFITNIQRIFLRNDLANIHFNKLWYISLSILQHKHSQ